MQPVAYPVMKRILFYLLLVLLSIHQLVVLPGCANIVPPQGGPRDSLPPVLLKATPGDSTRNFKGNRISFSFDEFVELQNVTENLNFSPSPSVYPSVDYRLNTVTVKLKDSLEPNTTYTLNFGNAIRDFTEGNPLKNFSYTFSTGNYIDSLELSGKVILAETGKTDSTLIVLLHTRSDDSAVVKDRPRYMTKLDANGNFNFRNLPPRPFYIYALKDEGGTRRYYDEKQLFAFADRPVNPADSSGSLTLYAWSVKPAGVTGTPTPGLGIGNRMNRTGGLVSDNRLRYQSSLVAGQQDLLSPFTLTFDQPLRSFDSTLLRLYTDSVYNPAPAYRFEKDSSNRKLTLIHTQLTGQAGWKENTTYHLVLDKEFAQDSAGKKLLKTDTLSFTTKKLSEYGSLQLKFRNLDLAKNPVLLFLSGETIVRSVPLSSASYTQSLFLPGDYDMRILFDDNKNGRWDPGQFFGVKKQPELVQPIGRKITVKAAWENEFDISL